MPAFRRWAAQFCVGLALLWSGAGLLATPISSSPTRTFVGNIDFAGTGATLRTASDAVDPCAVGTSSNATLSGIPAGATLERAYLYWAASGQAFDYTVNFNGTTVTADFQYSEVVSATRSYFSGVEDVTALISGNGTYSFSGLTVDTSAPYCGVNGVLAGWALVVIYSRGAEPFRTINMFEGFQNFWGSSVTLAPTNFVIPAAPIDGRLGVLSWEGDAGNSGTRNFVTENLTFDGQNTAAVDLTDALNPLNNQYNSTINTTGSTNVHGVDLDIYDISARLRAGDNAASTTYASGQDRVFLSLEIISVTNTPAVDLSLSKTASGSFVRGTTGTFDFTVQNLGPLTHNDVVTITDTLPAGLSYAGFSSSDPLWSCSNPSGSTVTCVHSGANLLVGNALPVVSVDVTVATTAAGTLTNSATLVSGVFDPLPANNTATADAIIATADLSTSQKTVSDLNSGLVLAGDTLQFTVQVTDSNNSVPLVNITDTLSGFLTNLQVIDTAGGADFSSGTTLDVRDVPVPSGASASVVFTADVVGTAVAGDVVTNTATIENVLEGGTLDVSSVDLTVGDTSGGASGNKPLYLDNLSSLTGGPLNMTRVPLTSNSTPAQRARIRREENNKTWLMTPATATTLSLASTAIPVRLQMRRSNNNSTRDIRVTLSYSGAASGLIGCADRSIDGTSATGLSNSVTREFLFTVPRTDANCNPVTATPLDLPAGTVIEMNIDNDPVGGNGRAIFVYPFAGGTTSHLELPATTVINVDTLEFYDDAYPGGTALTGFEGGDTIYIRSVVSDPFGSADITDATLTVMNSAGSTVLTQDLDPGAIVASDAATKTYEHAYSVPAGGPVGTWVANVLAEEGTEGTITHQRAGNFQVLVPPTVTLSKTSQTISDPMGSANPKSIPGAVIRFSIEVHNQGPGDADGIVVVDNLPPQARLLFDTTTLDPIVFVDGATPSGLSYNFVSLGDAGDDIEFSNNGGTSTITPSVDLGTGLDTTVPRINHLRITPQGMLSPAASGPSFTLQLLMQLD